MAIDPSKRTKSIKVYVFEKEKVVIEEKAAATSTTASEYLRSCGLKRALTVKPTPDLISIKVNAGRVKSELMILLHLVKETNNQQMLETVKSALVHVDKIIAAAFQINARQDKPDETVEN
ncbi:MobB protein [Calothrix sp. PCC 7716]|nr:MobB protein [Calothrix sp. PCC 7716]